MLREHAATLTCLMFQTQQTQSIKADLTHLKMRFPPAALQE